jgi:chemotaxis protein CheD
MNDEVVHAVGMGEIKISAQATDVLVAYGLGSCVAVCMYDAVSHTAGLLHAVLPGSASSRAGETSNATKYVEEGITALLEQMQRHGSLKSNIKTYLCGGAHLLNSPGFKDMPQIGKRNAATAEAFLAAKGMRIYGQDTGGSAGRTVKLYPSNGLILVKTLGQGEKPLLGGK